MYDLAEVSATEIDLPVYLEAKVARIAAGCVHAEYCAWSIQIKLERERARQLARRFVDISMANHGETI